jgi:hypothetical protein
MTPDDRKGIAAYIQLTGVNFPIPRPAKADAITAQ